MMQMMHAPQLLAAESWLFAYLLNALWQIPLLFAAAWMMTRLAHRAGPGIEHRIWVGAMLLEVILPACRPHLAEMLAAAWSALRWSLGDGAGDGTIRILMSPAHAAGSGRLQISPRTLTAVTAAYACILLYFAGRLVWGLWQTRALARNAESMALGGSTAAAWNRLQRISARCNFTVHIALSPSIRGPMTVGIGTGLGRMLLLLPTEFLEKIAANDLMAVLAHEYAHMRRRDFTKNLLYAIVSLPISWHPLLWATRSRVSESREMVCDAWAADSLAGGESYARSLLRLASALSISGQFATFHAIGIFDANIFERRIMNMTRKPAELRGLRRVAAIAVCALAAIAVCTSALALRIEPSAAAMVDPPKRIHVKGDVIQGNLLSQVRPVYPPEAKKKGIQGSVILNIVISKEGVPMNLNVVSGPRELQKSAIDAVRQWRYKPYLLNGDPIEVISTVTITYSLAG